MEELLTKLYACKRYLELADSIPYWEKQKPELKARIEEMKWNLQQKEIQLLQIKEPNFFQRLFGKAEEKKEILTAQIREITAARTAARWELEGLEKQITAGREEQAALMGAVDAYKQAKAEGILTTAQESRLMMEELTAFAPLAMATANRALEALEDARFWMGKDALTTRVAPENRKMECLYNAQDISRRLLDLISLLPEGAANPCGSFENLYDYICGATSEYKQLDRLNNVAEQLRTVRNQLKLLLGE